MVDKSADKPFTILSFPWGVLMKAKTWTIIILLFLCLVILLQNMEVVTLKVFFWNISVSRIIAFPLLVLMGMVIGFTLGKLTGKAHREKKKGGM
jgi:uncharacterized integral membrane protein